jgi:PAS domain S-box-containing protein
VSVTDPEHKTPPSAPVAGPRAWTGPFPIAAETLALALFYFSLAWVSLFFVHSSETVAAVWPPSAVLLGALLLSRRSHWPAYIAGALLASICAGLIHAASWPVAGGFAVANVAEATLTAFLLRRLFPEDFHLDDFRQLVGLFGIAAVATAGTGAAIAGLMIEIQTGGGFAVAWLNWWLAATSGILVICPLLLTWRDDRARQSLATRQQILEAMITLGAAAVLTATLFLQSSAALLFLVFPLAIWTAFRFGVFLTAFFCLMVALISMGMTWLGTGPIAGLTEPVDVELRLLQGFIAVMTSTALAIAITWELNRKTTKHIVANEQRFRDFAESASDRFWETDERHRYTWVSRQARVSGLAVDDVIGKTRMELAQGDWNRDEVWRQHVDDLEAHRLFRDFHYSIRGADGRLHYRRVSGKPIFDESGAFKGYRGTVSGVTQTVETELLATRLGRIIEEAQNEIYVIDAATLRYILVNRGARANLGYSMDELLQMRPFDICVGVAEPRLRDHLRQLDENDRGKLTLEFAHRRKNGSTYDVEVHLQRVVVGQTPPVYVAVVLDVSRRKKVHAELAAKSLLLQATLDTMAQGICVYDQDLRLAAYNEKYIELLGYPPGFIKPGGLLEDHLRECARRGIFGNEDTETLIAERLRLAREGLPNRRIYQRLDGKVIVSQRRPMPQGGFVTTFSDITQRHTTEEALQRSTMELQDIRASFEAAIKASRQILYDWNTRDDSVKWDGETDLILGYTAKELEALPDWMELIHPEDRRAFVRQRAQAVMAQDVFSLEYRVAHKDGRYIPVADRGVFLHGTQGGAKRIVGFISDMSTQKATEEALRQSDKLLAVGQLTGGIAHDFNNLLAIILGNLELLNEDLGHDPTHDRHIQTALTAAHRGASLTQRLLAFARKQPLQPRSTMVNHLVGEMSELLRRSLDPSISLDMVLADDLWPTTIDPSGLENALLNLALNARDAMPRGGKLLIETANVNLDEEYVAPFRDVEAGDYVMLSVSDTGQGMAPEIRDRAFEPFFTTKEVGRGSGLGLPMVYGFVKQSHGHVQIYSEIGYGTTVKVYLPRDEGELPSYLEEEGETTPDMGSGERVLVVEDNEEVRSLTNLVLNGLGYRTVLASDAQSALDVLAATSDIDVLFTDVVLPGGTNGFELAQRARTLRPRLKVLYTSGYTNNAMIQSGVADDTVVLIAKPYRKADLAMKMRQVLAKESVDGQR